MFRYGWMVVGVLLVVGCGDSRDLTDSSPKDAAANSTLKRFGRTLTSRPIQPAFVPKSIHPKSVKVMVRLEGEPITVVQAMTQKRKLTRLERDSVRSVLKEKQAGVRRDIEALGGSVIRGYQNAYNGFTVRVSRSQLGKLGSVHGVTGVYPVRSMRPSLSRAVPFVGGPAAWTLGPTGFKGDHVKVAVIDSGIDYTHANFGGPGTSEAYASAHAAEIEPPDPALVGPTAPRIKGGTDLVGDAYDADSDDPEIATPHPDPNPLDCYGHGSHVAGIIGGSGVTTDGETYSGPYDASTYSKTFRIGPGVAPRVDLYAVRVFGCDGSTDVTVDAIEWAVDNDMDVINMSLGSGLGGTDDPSAIAATNAVKAGVIVIASAGNDGSNPYVTGSPASAEGVLSVAAMDVNPTTPGALLTLDTGSSVQVQSSNGASFADGTAFPIVVLGTPDNVGLGCDAADYARPDVPGALVITKRGTCDRVARAKLGQAAGAAAVAMINTEAGYPPYEGEIDGVTIPFFGVLTESGPALTGAASTTATNLALENPGYRVPASFTSGGPRFGDSFLKPDVIAPGVSVVSTYSGTGSRGIVESGTSMAAPIVAGLAALVRQANPTWPAEDVKIALANTADPTLVKDYTTRIAGSGVPRAVPASTTRVFATAADGAPSLSLGFLELGRDLSPHGEIVVRNEGRTASTFDVSIPSAFVQGTPHQASLQRHRVRVAPGRSVRVPVRFNVQVEASADPVAFNDFAGIVQLTPVDSRSNGGIVLRVPYYGVVRPVARLIASVKVPTAQRPRGRIWITNRSSAVAGSVELYSWGIEDEDDGIGCNDIRAVGVQSLPYEDEDAGTTDRALIFAINSWRRCSNASINEYDVLVTNEKGDEYLVIGTDQGLAESGFLSGQLATLIVDLATGDAVLAPAFAPTDSSNVYLLALGSQLGLTADSPRFAYKIEAYNLAEQGDDFPADTAAFNAYDPALIGQGATEVLEPGAGALLPIGVNASEWARTPSKGLLAAFVENSPGAPQAAVYRFEGFSSVLDVGAEFPIQSGARREPGFVASPPRKDQ